MHGELRNTRGDAGPSCTHLLTRARRSPDFLGVYVGGLRETMTRGHRAVMEPFVQGNSHFPASPFTQQSMWTGATVKAAWQRSDSATCVLSV